MATIRKRQSDSSTSSTPQTLSILEGVASFSSLTGGWHASSSREWIVFGWRAMSRESRGFRFEYPSHFCCSQCSCSCACHSSLICCIRRLPRFPFVAFLRGLEGLACDTSVPIADQSILLLRVLTVDMDWLSTSFGSQQSLGDRKKHKIASKNCRNLSPRSTCLLVLIRCSFIRWASSVASLISFREYPRFFRTCNRSRDGRFRDKPAVGCSLAAQCSDSSKASMEYLNSVLTSQSKARGAPRATDGLSPKHKPYSLR